MTIETRRITNREAERVLKEADRIKPVEGTTVLQATQADHAGNSNDRLGNVVLVKDGPDGWLAIFDRVYSMPWPGESSR